MRLSYQGRSDNYLVKGQFTCIEISDQDCSLFGPYPTSLKNLIEIDLNLRSLFLPLQKEMMIQKEIHSCVEDLHKT
ncbi:hypothetical protein Y1Q_0008151 [Alligator mississippiensis]|uniref:Uncharacterized protein n=1 Tax=Alligator mississippiensis TaxID=8496 RepID=A0A151N1F9_ALLMI|nr:hypothetical protein Y1Q_0008151 [Alligator mississippiensis]